LFGVAETSDHQTFKQYKTIPIVELQMQNDKLSTALKNGLSQKSKVVVEETVTADPVNDIVPATDTDKVTEMMTGTDPKEGMMSPEKAIKFIDSLVLSVVVSNRAWNGNVNVKVTGTGALKIDRSEADTFDSSNPDRLIKNLLYKAFTEGRGIDKWSLYLPEVNQATDRASKVLSNSRLVTALTNLAKAGPIEVLLNANKRGFAPNLIVGNKASGSRSTTEELSTEDLVF
jgi:hypothetical protein